MSNDPVSPSPSYSSTSWESTLSSEKSLSRKPFFAAGFNLALAAVGAGILSYPYAMKAAGVSLTVVITVVFALLNAYSLTILARFTTRHYNQLKQHSYEELIQKSLGRKPYLFCVVVLLWNVFGVLIGFLIIIGDLGEEALKKFFTVDGAASFVQSREFVIIATSVCVILPLSLVKNLHGLWFSSVIGVVGVLMVACGIMARGSSYHFTSDHVIGVNPKFDMVFSINIITFALGCQLQIPPQVSDLITMFRSPKDKDNAQHHLPSPAAESDYGVSEVAAFVFRNFVKVIVTTILFCSILYNLTGVFGYLKFAGDTKGDILTNFDSEDMLMNAAKLIMAIHVVLAYPIDLFPGRMCVELLLEKKKEDPLMASPAQGEIVNADYQHVYHNDDHAAIDLAPAAHHDTKQNTSVWRTLGMSLAFVFPTALVAIFFPQVQVVFALVGASSSCLLTYVFPGWMLWHLPDDEVADLGIGPKLGGQILAVFGAVMSVFSTIVIIIQTWF